MSAYVRALLEAGCRPRIDLLEAALERLSASAAREHADYGRRQLDLMRRIADHQAPMRDSALRTM